MGRAGNGTTYMRTVGDWPIMLHISRFPMSSSVASPQSIHPNANRTSLRVPSSTWSFWHAGCDAIPDTLVDSTILQKQNSQGPSDARPYTPSVCGYSGGTL